jgi:hypothetical protein
MGLPASNDDIVEDPFMAIVGCGRGQMIDNLFMQVERSCLSGCKC